MPYSETMSTTVANREDVKPTLVYWHGDPCSTYWPITDGPGCPYDHDEPIYDLRGRRGRKRLMWICPQSAEEFGFLSRQEFLEHEEGTCYV